MARLLSVNVGLPRDVAWKGRTVHTGIWKQPVSGRCRAGRLNLAGDGQGDLAGHGGEQRAIFVYQIESYRYWQDRLRRSDFVHGQFGENFTVEGLPDSEVCIGDRFQIGSALFEVTQPRVTCYRIGIRMDEPRMPALLASSGRPGFYLRVLREGDVGAGDEIVQVGAAPERMTISDINALLYSSRHPRDALERAVRIAALSAGWRWSFEALLRNGSESADGGNAGLAPSVAQHPSAPGFESLTVSTMERECDDVISLTLRRADGRPLQSALPGQYVVIRLRPTVDAPPVLRSYSLSGASSTRNYRISIKVEPNGVAGQYLRQHVKPGDVLDVSAPRGTFTLQPGDGPVLLLSAGIGVTPVLAMLHALSAAHSTRQVVWLHAARDGQHHAFAAEARELLHALAHGSCHVCYSRPGQGDRIGDDYEISGRLSASVLARIGIPRQADVYLCGPARFMSDMKASLASLGIAPERVHVETFNGGDSLAPGIVAKAARPAHVPQNEVSTGPLVSFARSGITTHWNPLAYQSILELAEACDVPVRWSCRTGVCHNCESGLISGAVGYAPDPLDYPAKGNVLICCAQPADNIVVDI